MSTIEESLRKMGTGLAELGLLEEKRVATIKIMRGYIAELDAGDVCATCISRIEEGIENNEFTFEEIGITPEKLKLYHIWHAKTALNHFRENPCHLGEYSMEEERRKAGASYEEIGTSEEEIYGRMIDCYKQIIDQARKGSPKCFNRLIEKVKKGIYTYDELGASLEELEKFEANCPHKDLHRGGEMMTSAVYDKDLINRTRERISIAAQRDPFNFDFFMGILEEGLEEIGTGLIELGLLEEKRAATIKVMKGYVAELEAGDMCVVYMSRIERGVRDNEFTLKEIGITPEELMSYHVKHAEKALNYFRKSPSTTWQHSLEEEKKAGVTYEEIGTSEEEIRIRMIDYYKNLIYESRRGSRDCLKSLINKIQEGVYACEDLEISPKELENLEANCHFKH